MGMRVGNSNAAGAMQSSGVSNWQQRQQSFKSLSSALQSGDLGAAQTAFSSLSSGNKVTANPNSPLAQIGQALKTGDLAAAQQAFGKLMASRGSATATAATGATSAAATSVTASSNLGSVLNTTA